METYVPKKYPSAERNGDSILKALQQFLGRTDKFKAIEIASGKNLFTLKVYYFIISMIILKINSNLSLTIYQLIQKHLLLLYYS